MRARLRVAVPVAVVLALLGGLAISPATVEAAPDPPFIPADADWLTTTNYFRAMSHLPPVTHDPALSNPGATNHSCYMLWHGISHDENPIYKADPTKPGYEYTPQGDASGRASNVAISTNINATQRSFLELWMTGPFHAIGVLRPNLQRVGFGECRSAITPKWRSAATLNIISGLGPKVPQTEPILFPGNGTVTNLYRFVTESPNPVTLCGWSSSTPAGLPVIAMMPEAPTINPTATMTGPGGAVVPTCVLSSRNTGSDATAEGILRGNNAVVVVPRVHLASGTYTVTVNTGARSVTWSFTVDPAAADAERITPTASPTTEDPTGWQPISPARFVDSRVGLGATRLLANTTKRVKLTDRLGLPVGAQAISANFTVTLTAAPGYLTVWNCSSPMPDASTLNFGVNDTAANAATIPLDAEGWICLFSPATTDIIIDISGYYVESATSRFSPVTPERIIDTRTGHGLGGSPARMQAGDVLEVPLPDAPGNATGGLFNVTTDSPASFGWVTVYPCGTVPNTSSVNPKANAAVPNTVTTPLSDDGTICIYASTAVDVIVDVFGYMVPGTNGGFTPSTPFRWTDTRQRYWTDLNAGLDGRRLNAGEVIELDIAGNRGVPPSARAVSFNLTAADALASGFVTAFPCGAVPYTSNVNYPAGGAVANGATVALSDSGTLCLYAWMPVHLILDVNGWWE